MDKKNLVCAKCNVPLEPAKTTFHYLEHEFYADLPRCPKCGQVYLSEEIVNGKVHDVETELEEK